MKNVISRFVREEKGQDLIEYALLGTAVSLAAIVGAKALGAALNNWYSGMSTAVQSGASAASTITF